MLCKLYWQEYGSACDGSRSQLRRVCSNFSVILLAVEISIKSHRECFHTVYIRNDQSGSCDNCEPSNNTFTTPFACSYTGFEKRNNLYHHLMSRTGHFSFLFVCVKFSWHTGCPPAVAAGEKHFFVQSFRVSHCPFLIIQTHSSSVT